MTDPRSTNQDRVQRKYSLSVTNNFTREMYYHYKQLYFR